jgi:MoaA/NifB/PqqE/SkfB family radical SAM enzyme
MDYKERAVVPMIDLEISGKCNLHCPTCWGTPPDMEQEHGLPDWLSLLKQLQSGYGLESIVLAGGEPLLIPGIDDFIRGVHTELGLGVNLLTNAILLEEHFPKIRPHLASISIPLDGSTEEINRRSRGSGHYQFAVDWITRLNQEHPDLPLKVGTVVSTANISDIPSVGEVLLQRGFGDPRHEANTWKLYQVTAFGAQQESHIWKTRSVAVQDFDQLVRKTRTRFQGKMNVTGLSTEEVGGYCMIVRPNGNVVSNSVTNGKEHLLARNIFEDTEGSMKAIASYHPRARGVQRMASSYSYQGLRSINV